MKKGFLLIIYALLLSSCSGWVIQPLPYNPPTPIVLPTRTPSIFSPTAPAAPATVTFTFTPAAITETPTSTVTPSETPSPTALASVPGLQIIVLGCNTSIDITHGMGEVTNAFVTLKNTGNVELTNLVATLYAVDEGREHPDKILEVTSIPVGYEVTLKMTADSTYQQESAIQVEVNSAQGLFPREGVASCRDLGLFAPQPEGLGVPMPSNP